jgi:hypothetical protein
MVATTYLAIEPTAARYDIEDKLCVTSTSVLTDGNDIEVKKSLRIEL